MIVPVVDAFALRQSGMHRMGLRAGNEDPGIHDADGADP
jgi:hypothetical protein